ncbi:hypothetical protein CU254_12640 [Amycolatopsis sp. AA4]|nr:hypothetical protein CU254_12640 [Amycolatopsis sp. AA4]
MIGIYVGRTGTRIPTTKGMVVYAEDGAVHIYPIRP